MVKGMADSVWTGPQSREKDGGRGGVRWLGWLLSRAMKMPWTEETAGRCGGCEGAGLMFAGFV